METGKELLKPQVVTLADINGGYEYSNGDVIDADAINKTLGSVGYMQDIVSCLKLPPDTSGANSVGEPKVNIMPDGRFKFINLKGEQGEKGTGVTVVVGNELKSELSFTSDPQTQINAIKLAIYPVGALYISTNISSPASFIGGNWIKITSDAYLKIVTGGAGAIGGQTDHKIGVGNIPNQTGSIGVHGSEMDGFSNLWDTTGVFASSLSRNGYGRMSQYSPNVSSLVAIKYNNGGKDLPYYPGYYGIYAWKRIA